MRTLAICIAALCAACQQSGIELTLQFDSSVSDAQIASVSSFKITSIGDGDAAYSHTDMTSHGKRKETLVYHPLSSTTELTIAVEAFDGSTLIASGQSPAITVESGKTAKETVTLTAMTPPAPCTKWVSVDGAALSGVSATPYSSVSDALNAAVANDVICVGPGTYNEAIDITQENLTIRSLDLTQHAVIDGTCAYPNNPADNADAGCVEATTCGNNTDPSANLCYTANGLVFISASGVTWQAIDVKNSRGRGIEVYTSDASAPLHGVQILDSDIGESRDRGLVVQAAGGTVSGNTVHDSGNGAAYDDTAPDGGGTINDLRPQAVLINVANGLLFTNNTVVHNYGNGLAIGLNTGPTTMCQFMHNVIYDNLSSNVAIAWTDTVTFDSNLVYKTTDPWAPASSGVPDVTSAECITISSVTSNVVVSNNIVYGCNTLLALHGYELSTSIPASLMNGAIVFNTLVHGSVALHDDMTMQSSLVVADNLVWGTSMVTDGFTNTGLTATNNLWPMSPGAPLASTTDQVPTDPGLVSASYVPTPGAFDATQLELTQGSKAIGAGIAEANITTDYFGNTRATPPCIGADEAP